MLKTVVKGDSKKSWPRKNWTSRSNKWSMELKPVKVFFLYRHSIRVSSQKPSPMCNDAEFNNSNICGDINAIMDIIIERLSEANNICKYVTLHTLILCQSYEMILKYSEIYQTGSSTLTYLVLLSKSSRKAISPESTY